MRRQGGAVRTLAAVRGRLQRGHALVRLHMPAGTARVAVVTRANYRQVARRFRRLS